MNRKLTHLTFAGMAICFGTIGSFAGESVVYRFDDWTVTVTPRKSPDVATKVAKPTKDRPQSVKVNPRDHQSPAHGVVIRPVSFTQEVPVDQPTVALQPVPVDVTPELKPTPDPTISTRAVDLPASPTPGIQDQPAAPCVNCQLPIITPRPSDEIPKPQIVIPQTALYRDIYFSIPFNRVEYNAYPSYRHDATMELLFNQMRPTVIQRGTNYTNPYNMNYGPYYGYGYGSAAGYWDPPYYPFSYGLRIHQSR